MTRRAAKVWRTIAAVFTVVNVAGAGYAVANGEPLHAAVHVCLIVATFLLVRRVPRHVERPDLLGVPAVDERLERLQQSLDAISVEVERIGEAQRYAVKVVTERVGTAPAERSE